MDIFYCYCLKIINDTNFVFMQKEKLQFVRTSSRPVRIYVCQDAKKNGQSVKFMDKHKKSVSCKP